jgi:hypothetical protein
MFDGSAAVKRKCFRLLVLLGILSAAFLVGVSNLNPTAASSIALPIIVTGAPEYDPLAVLHGGERFPSGSQLVTFSEGKLSPLVSGFAATADAQVSFDGKSVLFAAKRLPHAPWQIYEMPIDKSAPRQVTSLPDDCIRPFYLPDGEFVYARKIAGHFALEVASLDGTGQPTRITYAPGSFIPTGVLSDGRILFESGFPLGTDGTPEVYAVYPDGSGVEAYRCDHGPARSQAIQSGNGDIIFVASAGLGRFISSSAHQLAFDAPEGDYAGGLSETGNGDLLVAWRSRASAGSRYSLQLMQKGSHSLTAIAADARLNLVEPVPIAPSPQPDWFPSSLHPWNTANLLALNSYLSRDGAIPANSIASVRVSTVDGAGQPKVLGTDKVQKDGSFFVQIPGNTPIRFELLNSSGAVIRQEHGWMWAHAGEQRVCVGCHTGPERAPDNVVPEVLWNQSGPTNLTDNNRHSSN